ncbi:hypothetical protein [Sphingobium yanoikuyae]|uniref:hypothetical protein n=1 Tax=Sphingobium yanoikuyae TaxID=13690 RepID=UPI0028AE0DDB|nr:hypothetical protein [Sphingobium yanoikuyae]
MIELAIDTPKVTVEPAFIDIGTTVRGGTNATGMRIDRPGGHYRAVVTISLGTAAQRAALVSALIRGKQEGLRMPFPLQGVNQSGSGSPVMDGADQTGRLINLRGLTPGYQVGNYWLSIVDASGQHYLHNVFGGGTVDGAGKVTVELGEHLRVPFADGAAVHLNEPMIEGDVGGDELAWRLSRADRLDGISFTIEEAA